MKIHFLKQLPLFSHLNETSLTWIAENLETMTYAKNEVIFQEGQKAQKLHMIFQGQIKIFKLNQDGKEHILHIMKPNELIGEVPLFEGGTYPANGMTMTESMLFALPRIKLIALIKQDPQIALNMLALQAKRLREFTDKIEDLSLKNTEQKFIAYLQEHAKTINHKTYVPLDNMNLQELANYLGIARENLSRIINKLIKQGRLTKQPQGFLLL